MSGQYEIDKELQTKIKEFVKNNITTYWGDLWKDHEIAIYFDDNGEAYLQID